jgi:hypothetical protein
VMADCTAWGGCPVEVGRELSVPSGHVDRTGRLDLWVRVGGRALVVVEVKKFGADWADTAKHAGYGRWIDSQPEPFKDRILVAAAGEEEAYEGFRLLTWERLCRTLRSLAAEMCADRRVMVAAMVLAFVGAVEQNLIGFSADSVARVTAGRADTFDTAVVDHLDRWLGPGEA